MTESPVSIPQNCLAMLKKYRLLSQTNDEMQITRNKKPSRKVRTERNKLPAAWQFDGWSEEDEKYSYLRDSNYE
jgi:hypothetical protein